jgi:hypothetical protein
LRVTLLRTGLVGLVVGAIVAYSQGQPARWPLWTAFVLWFSFGGHWVEIAFLNWIGPRLPAARWAQVAGRLLTWLAGGTLLMLGARATVLSLSAHALRPPPWWVGGPFFVCLELVVHALTAIRRHPNFYDGRR